MPALSLRTLFRGVQVRYITVAELREQAEQNAVTSIVAHRAVMKEAGRDRPSYSLVVRLNWRDEEHLVVRHDQGRPREWSSFDRMVAFLEREGVRITDLMVKFVNNLE